MFNKGNVVRLNRKSSINYILYNLIIYLGIAIIAFGGGLGFQKRILDNTN